jgi:hypothetical protein
MPMLERRWNAAETDGGRNEVGLSQRKTADSGG